MTHTSVAKTQELIDSQEYAEWLAMYERDPWGDDWQQAAGIMSLLTYGPLKKPMRPDEFIPGVKSKRPKQTPSQMLSVFKAFANFQNAKVAATAAKSSASKPDVSTPANIPASTPNGDK